MKPTSVLIACTLAALIAVSAAQSPSPQPWYQSFVDWNQQALNTVWQPANNAIQSATGTDLASEYEKWKANAANTVNDWADNARNTVGKRSVDRARRYA
uniref:Secreted protein n=1 Tax=Panagrellus redivivus TaxID=6233 RepID=A0A7E4ZUI2_PANRE